MRRWLSFLPAAAFFGGYVWTRDFALATQILIAAAALQIAILLLCRIAPSPTEWLIAALVLVFGGATLLLGDSEYLQIKTTVVNWLFALFLPLSDAVFKKNVARMLLGEFFAAKDLQWRRASNAMAFLFFCIGAINLAAIRHLTESEWVWTKTFLYPAASFVGLICIFIYLSRNAEVIKDAGR